MLIATHEMGFARQVADEVIFLHNGLVCETGIPSELLANPQSAQLGAFLTALRGAGRL